MGSNESRQSWNVENSLDARTFASLCAIELPLVVGQSMRSQCLLRPVLFETVVFPARPRGWLRRPEVNLQSSRAQTEPKIFRWGDSEGRHVHPRLA